MPRRLLAAGVPCCLLALCAAALLRHAPAPAAQQGKAADKDYKDQLPHIPPHAPADALKTFQLLPGLRIEQAAAEPLVTDPVAMSFDENGRLYGRRDASTIRSRTRP